MTISAVLPTDKYELVDVLNTPPVGTLDDPAKFKSNERPCKCRHSILIHQLTVLQGPVCRSAICAEKLFSRIAFEPSDADLLPEGAQPAGVEVLDMEIPDVKPADRKGKGKAKAVKPKRAIRRILDSDEESEIKDDISGFVVHSDEGEEENDVRRGSSKRLGKRGAIVVSSDDEIEEYPEDKEVLFGAPKKATVFAKPAPRFLPSTKMKVRAARYAYRPISDTIPSI